MVKPATILIVEDEKTLNDAYTTILTKENYTVLSAHDGEEALTILKKSTPDVILLDLRMPNVDGIEFLKRYKVLSLSKKPHIIVFSNLDMQKEIDQAYELGANKYILKAWASPKELVKLVADAVTKK